MSTKPPARRQGSAVVADASLAGLMTGLALARISVEATMLERLSAESMSTCWNASPAEQEPDRPWVLAQAAVRSSRVSMSSRNRP
ncbi:hypothetical protein [Streptosporangium sp. OZ121]|uniref:hypothetical protein n=1 Tax=Streptosporangium sp. OZ121 TaxID=3444183 RepID=UPI003F7A97E2